MRWEEVGFKEAVEEIKYPDPVGRLDVAVCHIRKDPVLDPALFSLLVGVREVVVFRVEATESISSASVIEGVVQRTKLCAVA